MSTERSKEWVLDRVRKLLTLAGDGGATEGERDNAMRMAHKLLAKYNVTMAEAEGSGQHEEERVVHSAQFFGRPWARVAAQAIAKLFFCEYLYIPHGMAKKVTHHFIGRSTNAITAAYMADYIVKSVMREAKKNQRAEDAGNIYYRSFATAASVAIYQRVERMIAEATNPKTAPTPDSDDNQGEPSSPGTALVLASHYEKEADANLKFRDSQFKKLGSGRSGKREYDAAGSSDGREYGNRVSLDRQLGGTTAPARKRLS